jgi:hypothetical protein
METKDNAHWVVADVRPSVNLPIMDLSDTSIYSPD